MNKKTNTPAHAVLMFGPPVSGKGSTARGLIAGLVDKGHTLEARRMIDQKKKDDPVFAEMSTSMQSKGEYLPDKLMHRDVVERYFIYPDDTRVLILDGLGRTPEQLRLLIPFLKGKGFLNLSGVFFRMQQGDSEQRFLETLSSADRANREDGKLETHIKRFRHHQSLEPDLVAVMQENQLPCLDLSAMRDPVDRVLRICYRFKLRVHRSVVEAYFADFNKPAVAAA